ncbi:MAG: amidohydrolase family protein, partial [Terriglobales bacterium]
MKTFITSLALSLCSCLAIAQPAPAPQKTAIHAGHLLDVKTGKMLDNVYVLIESGKIAKIQTSAPDP